MNNKGMIARFLGAFIAIGIAVAIGWNMIGPITTQINLLTANLTAEGNLSTSTGLSMQTTASLLHYLPAIFGIVIAIFGIAMVWNAFRNPFGDDDEGSSDTEDENGEDEQEEPEEEEEEEKDYKEKRYSYSVKKTNNVYHRTEEPSEPVPEIKPEEIKDKEKKFTKSKYD